MASNLKITPLTGLFIGLVMILLINPKIINDMYETILGKLVLILFILFISSKNITLGLLVALILIIVSSKFRVQTNILKGNIYEGMQGSISKDAEDILNDYLSSTSGVDLETIKTTIQPKDSAAFNVTRQVDNVEVMPSGTETFQNAYSSV